MTIPFACIPAKYLAEDASYEDKETLKAIQEMIANLAAMKDDFIVIDRKDNV